MTEVLVCERLERGTYGKQARADIYMFSSRYPKVAAPAATIPFFRNCRRFLLFLDSRPKLFMTSSFSMMSSEPDL